MPTAPKQDQHVYKGVGRAGNSARRCEREVSREGTSAKYYSKGLQGIVIVMIQASTLDLD